MIGFRSASLALLSIVGAATACIAQQAPPLLPEQGIGTQVVTYGSGDSWVRYLLLAPLPSTAPVPTHAVMLFAGGNGLLGITPEGTITPQLAGNFLVRTRMLFAQHSLIVAVVDAPGAMPLNQATRWTPEHARTMVGVIGDLRSRTNVQKIWLVGTSSGALSAANIAGLYPQLPPGTPPNVRLIPNSSRPNGVVLAASQTHTGQTSGTVCTTTIFDRPVRLPSINVPAYVAADRSDACPCSPPNRYSNILDALIMAPPKGKAGAVFPLDGSASPPGPGADQCTAFTPHGFYGIESEVVAAIAAWVRKH